MLRSCCFCLSLQVGCYIVAGFFFLVQILNIYAHASILPYLGPDEREDEENRDTRQRIKTKNIVWLVFSVLFCLIGFGIIAAAYLKRPLPLKILAVLVVAPSLIMLFKMPFQNSVSVLQIFSSLIPVGIFVYCALILWSFAVEILHPDRELAVYTNPSYRNYQQEVGAPDQQPSSYPSQQQLGNPAGPYPYPQQYQPYRNWQEYYSRGGQQYNQPPPYYRPQPYYQPQPYFYPQQPDPTQPTTPPPTPK